MVNVVTRSLLKFSASDVSLYGNSRPLNFGFTTGNDWVVDTGVRRFGLVDFSAGPLGAIHADLAVSLQFGLRLSAGLGGIGGLDTEYEIAVDVGYDDFVVAGTSTGIVGDGGTRVEFDFTKTSVVSASSASQGIGAAQVEVDDLPEDDQPEIPIGVRLDAVLGASLEIENITYKLPFRKTKTHPDIEIFDEKNQTINLFKLDLGDAAESFDLSDKKRAPTDTSFDLGENISISLALPTGADTQGKSSGSTIVSDKGYSNNPFLKIEGDLDALLVEYLRGVPAVGQALTILENSVFLSEEIDINQYIPFLPEEWFTVDFTVVDLSATAGLHVTEEVSVDIGYKNEENLPDFQPGGGSSLIDQIAGMAGADDEDPGAQKVPNVDVLLRSDNGTPDNLLDDHIARGFLGGKIELPQPTGISSTTATVTVDAFYDVSSAKVSHSVGLGGKFSVTLSVLSAAIGGKVGKKLGISLGPLFELEVPEDGLEVDLFNFFTRRFNIEGGTYDDLPTGPLTVSSDEFDEWGYQAGAFNQESAQYQYYWTTVVPASGLDEADPASRAKTIAFAEANDKWISEVRTLLDPLYEDRGIVETVILNTVRDDFTDFTFSTVRDTLVLWTANGSGTASVLVNPGLNNYVIAAPSEDAALSGLDVIYRVSFEDPSNPGVIRDVTKTLTAGLNNFDMNDFLRATSAEQSGSFQGGTVLEMKYGQEVLSSSANPSVIATAQNDLVVFNGKVFVESVISPGVNQLGVEAPYLLEGGKDTGGFNPLDRVLPGIIEAPITIGDVFLANFEAALNQIDVSWDMRAEELSEINSNGATRSASYAGFEATSFGTLSNTPTSQSLTSGLFEGSVLEFRDGDDLLNSTIVRDFESFLIRFGRGPDVIRTGTQGLEMFQMGDGNDRLIISTDRFADRYDMGEGDDFVVLDRTIVSTPGENFEAESDTILGGLDVDEVLISEATDGVSPIGSVGNIGLVWAVGDTFESQSGDYYSTTDTFTELFEGLAEVNSILGSKDIATSSLTGDGSENLLSGPYVQVALAGAGSNGARIAADVETITVDGFDRSADLVFFTGGDAYSGGDMPDDAAVQPVDVFVADFGAFEADNLGEDGQPLGAVLNGGRDVVVFGDTFVGGFERFLIEGTSVADVLVGGALHDVLRGGGGDDFLSGGGTSSSDFPDILEGGAGSDVFYIDSNEFTFIFGETAADVTFFGSVDKDQLTLQSKGTADGPDRGLRFSVVDLNGGERIDLDVNASFDEGLAAAASRNAGTPFNVFFGPGTDAGASTFGIEVTNQEGSDAWDDVLLYDGGSTYLGGESEGDRDLFVANFSDQVEGLDLIIEDNPEGRGLQQLDNGVVLGGVDRMIVTFGSGVDTVRGGSLNDYIDGGAGSDFLASGGGSDAVLGGLGDDFFYWKGDDGNDKFDGGDDVDRLLVSNVSDTGAALSAGGLIVDAVDANGAFLVAETEIRANTEAEFVQELMREAGDAAIWTLAVRGTVNTLKFENIEAVDVEGSDAFDDAIFFQNGLAYAGGERGGDADLFFGDFSAETGDMRIEMKNARPGADPREAFYDIGNSLGTKIGEFERFIVTTGSGDDTLVGGVLDDVFRTGAGNDRITGSLGNDDVRGGAGDDVFTYIGGSDFFSGGFGDTDRLEIAAQDSGYSMQFSLFDSVGVLDINANVPDTLEFQRIVLNTVLNEGAQGFVRQNHDYGSLVYEDIEFISTTGSGAGDVFISGTEGGVISSDGGNDILISRGGNDLLIGGAGRDTYVFGENMGRDIIANEFSGISEVHFIGRDFSDLRPRTDATGSNLILSFSPSNRVTITDFFTKSANPQNFLFFADDALEGRLLDFSGLTTTQGGAQITGDQFFGTQDNDGFDRGTDRAEFFFGFAGDDVFEGSFGADLLDGSLGEDLVSYEFNDEGISIDLRNIEKATGGLAEGDIFASIEDVIGTRFADTVRGNVSSNNLITGEGDDTLISFEGDDLLSAGDGEDRIDPGAGDDLVFAGAGDDVISAAFDSDLGDDVILGQAGNDTIVDLQGNNRITGGQGNDTVTTGNGDDIYMFEGNADPNRNSPETNGGEDNWSAGGGTDTADFSEFGAGIFAFTSNDSEQSGVVETSDVPVYDQLGNNRILLTFDGVENITGSDFDDLLRGSSNANVIRGGAGDDELLGRAGDDTLDGGLGFDIVTYRLETGASAVDVDLEAGTAVDSFGDTDTLFEIEGAQGSDFADFLRGSEQDNRLTGFAGFDIISGRGGIDTLDYSVEDGSFGISAQLDIGRITDTYGDLDLVEEIENFILTDRGDVFNARGHGPVNVELGGGDDLFIGSANDDLIIGGLGRQSVFSENGNDTYIFGNARGDVFDGGTNIDTLSFIESDVRVNVDVFSKKTFQFGSSIELMSFSNVERYVGSTLNDGLFGNNDAEVLVGWGGNDHVQGRGGDDTIFGNSGDDLLEGQAGADEIHGGTGNDRVFGGSENDSYFYTSGRDEVNGDTGFDMITFEALDFGIGVKADVLDIFRLSTLDIIDTPSQRELIAGPAAERLVDFTGLEHLIATDSADIVDNVTINGYFEQVDLGAGDDLILSLGFFTELNGGDGFDVISYEDTLLTVGNEGFRVDLSTGRMTSRDPDALAGDMLSGFEGIIGSGGQDSLIGDSRDNYFNGLGGPDEFIGGFGSDTVDYSAESGSSPLFVNLPSSFARDTAGKAEFLSSIENIIGTDMTDEIVGSDEDNRLEGGDGDDIIYGGDGHDIIFSGLGRDTILGGRGDDVMVHEGDLSSYDGQQGLDWIDLSLMDSAVRIDLVLAFEGAGFVMTDGTDTVHDFAGNVRKIADLTSVEHAAGSLFDDLIFGSADANILFGDAGDDIMTGFGSDDLFKGGAGFDIVDYSFDGGSLGIIASLTTNGAVDSFGTIDSFEEIEGLIGGNFNDVLFGDENQNLIVGNAGADDLRGGTGVDTLDYGRETGSGAISVNLLTGQATDSFGFIDQISGFEVFVGTTKADEFFGDDGDSTFQGGGGTDLLSGGLGRDTLTGGGGADEFVISSRGAHTTITDYDSTRDLIDLQDFDLADVEQALDNASFDIVQIVRTPGADPVETDITTLRFNEGGSLTLWDITVETFDLVTVLLPDSARPVLISSAGGGTVEGTDRPEFVQGLDGADVLKGGGGNDVLDGGLGDDDLDGGEGMDLASYETATGGGIMANLEAGIVEGAGGRDSLTSIEGVIGTQSGDEFIGSRDPDFFSGLSGADVFKPGAGGDTIETGGGADRVEGSGEELDGDRIRDFEAEDAIVVQAMKLDAAAVKVSAGSAIFEIDGDGDGVTDSRFTLDGDFSGQAFEVTSDGTDTTIALAGAGASQLSATGERFITTDGGENRVYGGLGDDVILSAGGADILSGGAGDDTLLGGNDDDILLGGLGNDTMTGGAGRDIFAIDASDFSAGFNSNFITDFTPGEDILELTGFGFNDFSGLSQQNVADGVLIVLGPGLISLNGLSLGDLGADDVSFGDAGRSYGLVSTTVVHRLTEEADRFLTTDPAANEVRAGGGDDVVIGAGGADVIYGEAGGDVLLGGAGADILQGGAGFDTLTGGADADQFVFEAGEETEFGLDVITDFTVGEDVVVATGFGLDIGSLDPTPSDAGLTLQLALNQLVVFQGIADASELGDLTQVFDFG